MQETAWSIPFNANCECSVVWYCFIGTLSLKTSIESLVLNAQFQMSNCPLWINLSQRTFVFIRGALSSLQHYKFTCMIVNFDSWATSIHFHHPALFCFKEKQTQELTVLHTTTSIISKTWYLTESGTTVIIFSTHFKCNCCTDLSQNVANFWLMVQNVSSLTADFAWLNSRPVYPHVTEGDMDCGLRKTY